MDNAKTKANDLYYRAQQNAPLNRRQVLGLVTILVAVGTVITIAGLTLTGTTIGFFLSLPVLIFFSPILVPLAIFAFFAISSLLGFGGFVSFAVWVYKYYKGGHPVGSDQVDAARYRIAEGAKEVKDRTYAAARDVQGYVASKTDTSVAA
ncbi:oleosin G [Physcomitrium patens]|jgi:hypothetical protein|uniref:Oleosin n=1 Tax=Physcomitrium patens TaxID=3218 RepID=A9SJ92_PHYPA|nr:oleosin Bn-III-like [Physcomitrium patens]PNR59670.1 hypothetical protein PHYPA_002462 [Physcomitrium patens]|eukprot:XP_024400408.1 oleosin Bn-III-like [Physcomitrella patens]